MQKFIENYFTSLFSMLGLFGIVYFIIWMIFAKQLRNRKIQLSKRAGWPQIKGEIVASILATIGSTLFTMLLFSLKDNGFITLYTNAGKYGIGYEIFSVLFIILCSDTWFYWLHRSMHHPRIYKYVHALHHKSLDVNPFTSNAFHVVEAVGLTLWVLPLLLLMPISAAALGIVQALGMINNLKSHLGYELFPAFFKVAPFNMLVNATNHSLHHTQYNGNYGLFFRFWDIICKTELKDTTPLFAEIHNRKNEQIIDNTVYKPLVISKLHRETSDTISVYFTPEDNFFYNYTAGQHLTIRVNIKGKIHDRVFSLSSIPKIDNFLRITVKLKGEVSKWLMTEAKVGDTIQSLYPVGDFVLPQISINNYVFVAGGSGITPLYSMINTLLVQQPNCTIKLLYANKNTDEIIFKKDLDALAVKHTSLNIIFFISGQNKIAEEDLVTNNNAIYYICGPDGLKNYVVKTLQQVNVLTSQINIENFADGYVGWFGLLK
jgi:ring-1,2-phenylacetyl-CoA epoxidase subunit PaaE